MKKNNLWFTLIELIVVISLIGILFITSTRMNFNINIDSQKSWSFTNEVFTKIETVRNNSLLWKWLPDWTNMIHPDEWILDFSTWTTTSWTASLLYLSWWNLLNYNDFKINFIDNNYSKISKLTCYDVTWANPESFSNIKLEIYWSNLSLSWCTSPNDKILDIETKYKWLSKIIRINTVSWIIEKK